MNETVRCPGCEAQLALPSLPTGQTVQCPRCRHVFEPVLKRAAPAVSPPPIFHGIRRRAADELDDDEPFAVPVSGRPEPLRGEGRALFAMVMLALSVLSYGVQFYFNYERAALSELEREMGRHRDGFNFIIGDRFPRNHPHRVDPRIEDLERRLDHLDRYSGVALFTHHLIYWPTMVVFLLWFNRAYRNLRNLRAEGLSDIPFLATASFFVPVMNLFRPYMVMQEIWRASDPRSSTNPHSWKSYPGSMLVKGWWFAFLVASAASVFASVVASEHPFDEGARGTWISCKSNLGMIAAGVLLIFIIYGIKERQRERYAQLYAVSE